MKRFYIFAPILVWLYTMYLGIALFMIPAFKLYFDLYGVAGTFLIWAALTIVGYICGWTFAKILLSPHPMATYKRTNS